ncbi:class I SAM-dependent methyltransferase [Streptomyces griseofuscus]|uniref:Methyltransferase domain-containing protein n=1 Tax=Streptomyces griseofuscus TaxID=146922 RepID=A0A426S1L9_9ACTN|nr:hypothetical protein CQW44_26020 [Streptomyces griseofuscus]
MTDPGSGPGGVTALLHELGVPAFGIDLSPEMVAPAREAHPQLRFHVGSMMSLNIPSASLGEFHRTLRPGPPRRPGHRPAGGGGAGSDRDRLP